MRGGSPFWFCLHCPCPFVRVCACVALRVSSAKLRASQVTDNGGEFIVEQPQSSLMFDYVPWRLLQHRLWPWMRWVSLHLGAFGAPTPKLTKLIGTCEWLPKLKRPLGNTERSRIEDADVKTALKNKGGRVSGSKQLKATQTYPVEFGAAVAVEFSGSYSGFGHEAVALATKTALALATMPISERPHVRFGVPFKAGDDELWVSADWWLQDILKGEKDHWDARLEQGHSLELE